ncbi:hypothetical protein JCM4814A_02200 [Streptomyces phaeofaciens JCM 4814]|uniref:Uncharacterized protein n=1 Tax=Streptomyces phaeofaciens TaxID=68254 RepID=A0A918HQ84_9ACTN|nr:hypothetical protein GCM10010226_84030 [Streptomyces phaeofaciens]
MTTYRSWAALAAVAVTATVLLARWWVSYRHSGARARRHNTGPPGGDRVGEPRPAMPDAASEHALREVEEHLSRHWERLRSLYPRHPDDTAHTDTQ